MTIIVLLPTLVLIFNERAALQEEKAALFLIDQVLTAWVYENEENFIKELQKNSTSYYFTFSILDNQLTTCIKWNSINGRYYERCESVKK